MKKTVYVLDINNYAPEIKKLTYPFIQAYAKRIGAELKIITKRKFPDWPVVYEKLQIYELGRKSDWNIYIDSDALVHPETIDFTEFLKKDTVLHNGADIAAIRWDYDEYFRRDGRHIGSCNWFTIASNWCLDLWHPLDDLTLSEAVSRIHPTVSELRANIDPSHLIDDYTLSRNIAKYGLKFTTAIDFLKTTVGLPDASFFHHVYTEPIEKKVELITKTIKDWNIPR